MITKVPKYVTEFLEGGRIKLAPVREQDAGDAYGYIFRLYRRSNGDYEGTFKEEAERLAAWARREFADAKVLKYQWYTVKEHRKPYYYRDFALIQITDPVAQYIEKQLKA